MSVSASTRGDVSDARASAIGYLPGLDGLRALAVIAVIVYHADADWLPGGFLGVEVFFVLSGYLITRLLVREDERTGGIDLFGFWGRRARRLLPALALTLLGVLVVTALLRPDAAGQVRGDVVASAGYVANWYQLWVGDGYAAAGDFAPLRHLWSLAIEEQFYLVWPVVVLVLLRRGWSRLAIAVGSVSLALASVGLTALLVPTGPIGDCAATPDASWTVGERCIAIADALYLSTFTRGSGLLLGAAFALVSARSVRSGRSLGGDVLGGAGAAVLVAMSMTMYFSVTGVHPFLFRGGFLLVDVATLMLIAAVTRPATITAQALSARTMCWVGTRSYGLYLYHWPIFQLIRRVSGNPLAPWQFVAAILITALVAEGSYRAVEMPIRRHGWRAYAGWLCGIAGRHGRRAVGAATILALLVMASTVRVVTADHRPNEIAVGLAAGAEEVVSIEQLLAGEVDVPATGTADGPQPIATTTVPRAPAGRPIVPTRMVPPEPRGVLVVTAPTTTIAPTTAPPEATTAAAEPPDAPPPATAPATTQPATTVPPSPTAPPPTAPPAAPPPSDSVTAPAAAQTPPSDVRIPMLAIGDSVMLGAAAELSAQGWVVNAQISRQMISTVPTLEQLRDAGVYGDVVLLHLGTNGSISNATLDAALAALADVPLVILVTIRADRSWAAGTSDKIRQRAGGNVVVMDWAVDSRNCPGRCFEDDGIHLRSAGRRFYADLVAWKYAAARSG